jgi:hypothetical protein
MIICFQGRPVGGAVSDGWLAGRYEWAKAAAGKAMNIE